MSELYWFLAIAAVVVVCVLLVTVSHRRKSNEIVIDLADNDFGDKPVTEDPSEDSYDEEEGILAKDVLKKKYELALKPMNIPEDAVLLNRKINIFDVTARDIMHYCWISSKSLMFFPQWESIENCFYDCAIEKYKDDYDEAFTPFRIPRGSVGYWRVMPDKTIELCYAPARGEKAEIILSPAVTPLLAKLMPDRELSYIMKNIYPKSSQNISDMSSEHKKLKEKLANGEITEEEYEKGKMYIFAQM